MDHRIPAFWQAGDVVSARVRSFRESLPCSTVSAASTVATSCAAGRGPDTVAVVHIVLVNPQIAPNTGNLIRLCANTGNDLHLVEPLGFRLDDSLLKRGGLDYHERTRMTVHPDLASVRAALPGRWFAFSTHSTRRYTDVEYRPDDVLVFGCEGSGLDPDVSAQFDPTHSLTIPLRPNNRSLNLANAVSVVVFEAWRQTDFEGAAEKEQRVEGLTGELLDGRPFDL
jgi:tRNA (cytidine/uridine-2'-O-)-methyltransferase